MNKKWFTYLILLYLIVAVGWWTLLLFRKNASEYDAKLKVTDSPQEIGEIQKDYKRQQIMILGEGIFLGASLLAGIFLIIRSQKKELQSVQQQNNFIMAVTHELKSPISAVDLTLQTIERRSLDDNTKNTLTKNARKELARLGNLVTDLLLTNSKDFNANDSKEKFKLSSLLFDLIQEASSHDSELEIDFNNYCENEGYLKGNREYIKRAIFNVLDNAIKYGRSAKPISIKIQYPTGNTNYIELSIIDNGIGIPNTEKSKVFDKFYRVGEESIREYDGTGIGLYLTKKILADNGGDIKIMDNIPCGSQFIINLPLDES